MLAEFTHTLGDRLGMWARENNRQCHTPAHGLGRAGAGKEPSASVRTNQCGRWAGVCHLHLADAFIQSDLHCIQVTVSTFYQLLLSLGIEPMILALLTPCSTSWATGKLYVCTSSFSSEEVANGVQPIIALHLLHKSPLTTGRKSRWSGSWEDRT